MKNQKRKTSAKKFHSFNGFCVHTNIPESPSPFGCGYYSLFGEHVDWSADLFIIFDSKLKKWFKTQNFPIFSSARDPSITKDVICWFFNEKVERRIVHDLRHITDIFGGVSHWNCYINVKQR